MHCLPAFHDPNTVVGREMMEDTGHERRASRSPARSSSRGPASCSTRPRTACTRSRRCSSPRWGAERVRILVALGGNALLKRGEPMTAEVQRANVRTAARALAPVAEHHQLVLSHGNGPQVGLLALQAAAYKDVEAVSARRARRADGGDDRLPHRAGARQPAAGRGAVRDDPHDDRGRRRRPGVRRPDEVRRADLRRRAGGGARRREGLGRSSATATTCAAWCRRRRRSGSSRSGRSAGCSTTASS